MKELNEWAEITKNLAEMINASSKSGKQIASEIGITPPALSQYLSGRSFPSLVTLKHLCKALDCEYEDILGEI